MINELQANPVGTDTGFEWIEILNADAASIDLDGWTIDRAKSSWATAYTFVGTRILAPGELLVVGDEFSGADLLLAPGTTLDLGNAGANGDAVRLADPIGQISDTAIYGPDNSDGYLDDPGAVATSAAPMSAAGRTLARRPFGIDSDDSAADFVEGVPLPGMHTPWPIFDVRTGLFAETSEVLTSGIVTGLTSEGVYLQDSAGGPYSAVFVYLGAGFDLVWGPVAVGDWLAAAGTYIELSQRSEIDVLSSAAPLVQTAGPGPLPPVMALRSVELAAPAAEPWESALVEVDNALITATPDPNGEWRVSDDATNEVIVDDERYTYVHPTGNPLVVGQAFDRIAGPLSSVADVFKIEPGSLADVVDAPITTLINSIQLGSYPEATKVQINDSCVTAAGTDGVFVQHFSGGQNSGIWLHLGAGWDATGGLIPGDVLRFVGRFHEVAGRTEVDTTEQGSWTMVGHITLNGPAVVSMTDLDDPTTREAWEGVLIAVPVLEVTLADNGNGEFEVTDPFQPTGSLVVGDAFHSYSGFGALQVNDTFTAISGVLDYSAGQFKLEPRDDGDFVP